MDRKALKKYSALSAIFVGLALLLLIPLNSHGMKARIVDFLLSSNEKELLAYFKLADCFTRKMDEAVMAGIPATFTFRLELSEKRPFWFNRTLSKVEFRHTLKYDSVKNMFFVKSSLKENETLEFKDFARAKRAMEDVSGVRVAQLAILKEDSTYFLGIKAKLDRIRLPLSLEHILFFVSLWDFETDNYIHSFQYKKAPAGERK